MKDARQPSEVKKSNYQSQKEISRAMKLIPVPFLCKLRHSLLQLFESKPCHSSPENYSFVDRFLFPVSCNETRRIRTKGAYRNYVHPCLFSTGYPLPGIACAWDRFPFFCRPRVTDVNMFHDLQI